MMQAMLRLRKTLQMVPEARRCAHHRLATRYIKNAIFRAQRGDADAAQDYYAHAQFHAHIAFTLELAK